MFRLPAASGRAERRHPTSRAYSCFRCPIAPPGIGNQTGFFGLYEDPLRALRGLRVGAGGGSWRRGPSCEASRARRSALKRSLLWTLLSAVASVSATACVADCLSWNTSSLVNFAINLPSSLVEPYWADRYADGRTYPPVVRVCRMTASASSKRSPPSCASTESWGVGLRSRPGRAEQPLQRTPSRHQRRQFSLARRAFRTL